MFRLWVIIVTFSFIFTAIAVFAEEHDVCKHEQKYSQIWYVNGCDNVKTKKLYTSTSKNELPWDVFPTEKVLKYYANRYSKKNITRKGYKFTIKADGEYRIFDTNLSTDDFVTEQLNTTALLSYIMYANGEILVDQKTEKYSKYFNDKTKWTSMSMGKSIISYMTGHAICRGYISGINETMNWDIFDNTYYENAKLINVLNMASGNPKNHNRDYKKWPNNSTIQGIMKREIKNTTPGENVYNYSNVDTNVVASYLLHKMGHKDFKKLLNYFFNEKVNVQHNVKLFKQEDASSKTESLTYAFYLTRYDYLRVAVAMLDDWNNNTCEGQYLKDLYENKINKFNGQFDGEGTIAFDNPTYYAGFFHTYADKPIFVLDGYGGQSITIDFENNKIQTLHAIHRNYDWMKLVHSNF